MKSPGSRPPAFVVIEVTLDVHVTRLRQKVKADRPLISTVRGVGYRLATDAPGQAALTARHPAAAPRQRTPVAVRRSVAA